MIKDMEESMIGAFEQIFVEVEEDKHSEDDVDIDVAIKFIYKFWNV